MLLLLGIGCALASALALGFLALAPPAASPAAGWPLYGKLGLGAWIALELLLALHAPFVVVFFTSLIWTAYIAVVDGAVYRLRGDSLLRRGGSFWAMAALSIPSWLIFEAYNLRLRNWVYVGLPRDFWEWSLGAAWAFATITPGILETADLIETAWCHRLRCRRWRRRGYGGMAAAGLICLVIPLVAPQAWAPYLFLLVWAGFIFALDPLHRHLGWPSLLRDLERGRPGRLVALLLAGAGCGFFWEFWNFWAQARWQYVFPILLRDRVFAMPAPGFLGFPPFAVECFTVYVFLAHTLLPPRLRAPAIERYGSLNDQEDPCPDAPI